MPPPRGGCGARPARSTSCSSRASPAILPSAPRRSPGSRCASSGAVPGSTRSSPSALPVLRHRVILLCAHCALPPSRSPNGCFGASPRARRPSSRARVVRRSPWCLTSSIEAAAAAGSRKLPPRPKRGSTGESGRRSCVELVEERNPGRQVHRGDRPVGDRVEVLDERAQRIAVGRDEHEPAGAQVGDDHVVPVGQHAREHVLEAFGAGQQVGCEAAVARVPLRGVVGGGVERRRCDVEGASPEHELLIAELAPDLLLVLALERPVVALVQPPGAAHRDPAALGGGERELARHDRARQHGGMQDVRLQAVRGEQLACGAALPPRRARSGRRRPSR